MPPALRTARAAAGLLSQVDLAGYALGIPLEKLFDDLPNVVFFIKDRSSRYLMANRTLMERCAFSDKSRLLGKTPSELFPQALATRYERQDQRVVQTGKPLLDLLELHLYPSRRRGWCLTNKYPVYDTKTGSIVGVAGVSRDVETSPRGLEARGYPELAAALEQLQERVGDPPGVEELAAACGLSTHHFGQLVQRLFHLTPRQLLMKVRMDEALFLLATTTQSLADIALATGFCDQSAFTRHFRRLAGLPPGAFRGQLEQGSER